MEITEVKVSAGRTFNHPYESYSNLRCDVHLSARVQEGEDGMQAARELQARAEELCEGHKVALLKNIEDLQQFARTQSEVSELERRIRQANDRLNELKKSTPGLLTSEPDDEDDNPFDQDWGKSETMHGAYNDSDGAASTSA